MSDDLTCLEIVSSQQLFLFCGRYDSGEGRGERRLIYFISLLVPTVNGVWVGVGGLMMKNNFEKVWAVSLVWLIIYTKIVVSEQHICFGIFVTAPVFLIWI